jgi:hypothetical protein
MAWVAMLFLLLAVEYRAIDKDRDDFVKDQQKARAEERASFREMLEQQQGGVEKILHQQQEDVRGILQQEQQHFDKTIQRMIAAQQDDRRDFQAMLNQQQGLFEQQREMIDSLNGHLLPSDEPMPSMKSLGCEWANAYMNDNSYLIITGPMVRIVNEFPDTPLVYQDSKKGMGNLVILRSQVNITVDKSADGLLVLSMDIRDKTGLLVVRFDENGFEVNPILLKRHPNKSRLIVEDLHGDVVFKAVYANKHVLRLDANIVTGGDLLVNTGDLPHICVPQVMGQRIFVTKPPSQ